MRGAKQGLERVGVHDVVGLQDAHILAARLREAAVQRVAVAGVGLLYQPEAVVLLDKLRRDLRGAVSRPVVQADELEVALLRTERLQARRKVPLDVVDGHEDGCGRHGAP